MKNLFLLCCCLVLPALSFADSAGLFCGGDNTEYSNMVNCHINAIDDCRDAYPTCAYDDYTIFPSIVISNLIDRCCALPGGDSAWDACFLKHIRKLKRAKAIPKKFRRDVSQRIKAYINNAELQCTEA